MILQFCTNNISANTRPMHH